MSLNRFDKRRDANQREIVQALEQVGAEVWILDRPCDLAVWFRRAWHLLETKTRTGRYTALQLHDREKGRGEGIRTVRSAVEALQAIGAIDGLSP